MKCVTLFLAAGMLAAGATIGLAQEDVPDACLANGHVDHQMAAMTDTTGMNDMQKAYAESMDRMHPAMMAGVMMEDPDVAFVCGMIAHHQGAVDMAKIELQYGKDETVRALSSKIIEAQTQEIADMRKWLEEHGR